MQYKAVLGNPKHPEYGLLSLPFPIPKEQYASDLEMLEALGVGDAVRRDCHVREFSGHWPVLKNLEGTEVNIDELDYLAKRLDSFDVGKAAQFQAMASRLELHDMTELINLTFCCQQVTVITDFSDLGAVGRAHYMNRNGGCASAEELEKLDGAELARQLIDYSIGRVTPYGVVYDNDMELEQFYDGRHFPEYLYEPCVMELEMTHKGEPEDTKNITYLYLPMAQPRIERAMLRGGVENYGEMRLRLTESELPEAITATFHFERENLSTLNELCAEVSALSQTDRAKLGAVCLFAKPEGAPQVKNLAERLELFDFVPGAASPEDYGRYLIRESGRFEYDESLDSYYDYARYASRQMEGEHGAFNPLGYVAYHGTQSFDALMLGSQGERMDFRMGGLE